MPTQRPKRPGPGSALVLPRVTADVTGEATQRAMDRIALRSQQLQAQIDGAASAQAGGHFIAVQTLTGIGTYAPTTGATRGRVRMCGGGGGGGGVTAGANATAAAGGASGVYLDAWIGSGTQQLVGGAFSCGAGGVGGPASTAGGAAGGTTSLTAGGRTLTAPGGGGGSSPANAASSFATGGQLSAGGTPFGAVVARTQMPGGNGINISAYNFSGNGGSGPLGAGGQGDAGAHAGAAADGYGAGGAGANGINAIGGAGSPGVIVIEEYA